MDINTKLICVEGIPGSGKSSTAQYLSRRLKQLGIPCKWWYEEELGHPVYVYTDAASAQKIIHDLTSGNYKEVIEKSLKRWSEFTEQVAASNEIVIIDGCLFGYLTWSLFPNNVDVAEIHEYVAEVERIIAKLNPHLIHLYQADLDAALNKIIIRRGEDTKSFMLERANQSHYGKAHALDGFEGVVTYWQNYREVMDALFHSIAIPKLAIENHEGNWLDYYQQINEFIGIPSIAEEESAHLKQDLSAFTGRYSYPDENGSNQICTVHLESNKLIVDGLPQVWTKTALLPDYGDSNSFVIASLPFQIRFFSGSDHESMQLQVSGPALLDGSANCIATKIS